MHHDHHKPASFAPPSVDNGADTDARDSAAGRDASCEAESIDQAGDIEQGFVDEARPQQHASDDAVLDDETHGREAFDDEEFDDAAAADTLSPAVRRLVKTYDLDVAGIRGSGPSGRIRVGDVMRTLGSRAAPGPVAEEERATVRSEPTPSGAFAGEVDAEVRTSAADAPGQARHHAVMPATTVFECDIGGVLAHRNRERGRDSDFALASYFLAAAVHASRVVPEVSSIPGRMHVAVHGIRRGQPATKIVRDAQALSFEALNAALTELDPATRGEIADTQGTTFSVNEHGALGSVLAIPTPLGVGHAASLGIGRPRRQMLVRNVDGRDTARAVALCYVSLSYDPARVRLERANLYLSKITRAIERWQQI